MRLLHLSDLHMTDNGFEIWGTDVKGHFDRAIELIRQLDEIDGIIVTGDLSNDGSEWSYSYISRSFKKLNIPFYCCPGNHDCIETMVDMGLCKVPNVAYINDWKLLMLNSTIHDMSRGILNADTLSFVDSELSKDCMPTIIAFHHPPIEPGGWLNRRLLENRDFFTKYISEKNNVKLVLYGHIHYHIQHRIGNTLFSAAPSIGYAFDKDMPKFQIAKGQEGFDIIDIHDGSIQICKMLI